MSETNAMLNELARLSQAAGARPDYIQGGGGNTSVKLDGGLMAIKTSGYRLSKVTETDGFAVVEVDTLKDVTSEHGYKALRPSVEVGFHAALPGRFVLHTHPVYCNLLLCSQGGMERLAEIMNGLHYITVPYRNPGAELCEVIKGELKTDTQIVFMQNHGVIVTADSADECLTLHDEINERAANVYSVTPREFKEFSQVLSKTLYPDQQVYLELTDTQKELITAVSFIQFTLMKHGQTPQGMDESTTGYIAGREGDKYKKSVL